MSFKLVLGIILGFSLLGCGKEKKIGGDIPVDSTSPSGKGETTNTPNGTIKLVDNFPYPCDAKVAGNIVYLKGNGFQVCSEQDAWQPLDLKGDMGPQGIAGPKGGSSLVAVYDAQDRKLGWLMQQPSFNAVREYHVLLTCGNSVELLHNGYIGTGNFPFTSNCYYQTSDCSGTCRAAMPLAMVPISSETVGGNGDLTKSLHFSGKVDLGTFNYQSWKYSGSCSSSIGTLTSSYSVLPLALASGATYPFEGPISLKAE